MTSLPLRIAILECDTPQPQTNAKYGGYGGVFTALLKAGADLLGHPGVTSSAGLQISSYDVVTKQEYPSLEDVDGVLISGSKFNSFDNDEWILKLVEFSKKVLAQERVRVIGVCFGHQILGRAIGTKVGRSDNGWEISVTAIDLTAKGQELFGQNSLAIHQMHRDIVYEYPEGTEELAYTDKCAVQGFYIHNRVFTVQGHPEFNEEIMKEILNVRRKAGIFDQEMFEDALARSEKRQDGVVVAKAFLKFLLE